jgi:hypothetical protein
MADHGIVDFNMLKRILIPIGWMALALAASAQTAQFTADGQLIAPKDYRDWVFLSSGLGMTYGPISGAGATPDNPRFENVFVNPPAYQAFLKTGTWPDGTVLILEIRSSVSKLSINKAGRVQSEITGIEANVRDSKRFPGNWAFFDLSNQVVSAKPIATTASCYSCHTQNGAVDKTFVQFYPTLIDIARRHGTYHEKAGE